MLCFCYLGMLQLEHRIYLFRHHSWREALFFPYRWPRLLTFGWTLTALALPATCLIPRTEGAKQSKIAD